MDAPSFDAATQRLSHLMSRRRGLGLLAALGLGASLSAEDVHGKKRKKKRNKNKNKNKNDNTPQPPPACVPESQATTCGGRCGSWKNNCGKTVACSQCPGGQKCSSNGSCMNTAACDNANNCPGVCQCSFPNTEGDKACIENLLVPGCPTDTCESTADCPTGFSCLTCPFSTSPKVCVPLCRA